MTEPRIIKVDCDKWKNVIGITLWSLITVGLLYALVYLVNFFLTHQDDFWYNAVYPISLILIIFINGINLFFVINEIYERQNKFKFQCISKEKE